MKILVTGGAGFIGSSICLKLKEKYPEYEFIAFDNLKRRGSELNVAEFRKAEIGFIHGDIRNIEDLDSVGEFDILIDCSAEPSVLSGLSHDPTYIINNNLFGSINCFNTCLKYGAKIIFLSTSRVYPIDKIEKAGFVEDNTRFSLSENQNEKGISKFGISEELCLTGARSFYGATKLSSELFIQEYSAFYNLKTCVTRFGVIAGPHQMGKTDQGIATFWMACHYWKKPLKYIGYGGMGKQVRDILHIDDLINLIDIQIHNTEKFNGKVFNAGGGLAQSISLLEMTSLCEKISGNKTNIESDLIDRKADLRIYITDNTKIENETGWKPQKNLESVFEDIFCWINNNEKQLKQIFL